MRGSVAAQPGPEGEMPGRAMTEREIVAAWIGTVLGFVWGLLCGIAGFLTFLP